MMNAESGSVFPILDKMMLTMLNNQFELNKVEKVRLATLQLKKNNGNVRIEELTRLTNMSSRELERKFNVYVGLSPKQLARIFRLQYALRKQSQTELLTHLALDAGYYDQAHFIREFSGMVNEKPSQYFQLQQELTEKFLLR